jgi:hypothetical protein
MRSSLIFLLLSSFIYMGCTQVCIRHSDCPASQACERGQCTARQQDLAQPEDLQAPPDLQTPDLQAQDLPGDLAGQDIRD